MGLFTRKDPAAGNTRSGKSRPLVSSEAQAAEFRGRARRRLAGAVALVLAAIIILPMMLDSQKVSVPQDVPIRIPDRTPPAATPGAAAPGAVTAPDGAAPSADSAARGSVSPGEANPSPANPSPISPDASNPSAPGANAPSTATAPNRAAPDRSANSSSPNSAADQRLDSVIAKSGNDSAKSAARSEPKPTSPKPEARVETRANRPEARTEPKSETKSGQSTRTDDGERALALLEGRPASAPARPAPAASAKGNFVLQVASLSSQSDAQERREKLRAAGVTNAFVEQATISGKPQFRLRVGPFPSRDAAQAAQARLRTLGYDNGFIAAQ